MANTVDKKDNMAKDKNIESKEIAEENAADAPSSAKKAVSNKPKSASGKAKASSSKSKASSSKKEATSSVEGEVTCEVDASSPEDENNDIVQERNKYLRLAAEYDNYRKRSAKEREMTYAAARVDTIAKLLPVYDNLERALKMECADEAYYKGVEMTMTQLLEIFEGMDVKPIPAVGEPFDPNHHNAVMTVENPELGSKIVAEEFQKGFILGEKVIRHSTVVVAN